MSIDYAVLLSELQNDPAAFGYASHIATGEDGIIAALMNSVPAGPTPAIQPIRRQHISSEEILQALVLSEMSAFTSPQLAYIQAVLNVKTVAIISPSGTNTQLANNLLSVFGVGTTTRANLISIATRNGSRAETLFGEGVHVAGADIAKAQGRG